MKLIQALVIYVGHKAIVIKFLLTYTRKIAVKFDLRRRELSLSMKPSRNKKVFLEFYNADKNFSLEINITFYRKL